MPLCRLPDLAETTLRLVDAPSESRDEAPAVDLVRELMPGDAGLRRRRGPPLRQRADRPRRASRHGPGAGEPPRADRGRRRARRRRQRHEGRRRGDGRARARRACRAATSSSRARRCRSSECPLPALFATDHLDGVELAVVLEPTDCILHAGCLGNIQARVTFHGESAHSARPWTGVNAIHELVRGLEELVELEPLDVELDGLVYREVVERRPRRGRDRRERRPRARERRAELPLHWATAPRGRLRELVPHGEVEVLSNSPSAPPALTNPHVARLRELVPEVAPKQAWTPVAQFAEQGIDAINYGPGLTRYAHRHDEQIPVENLVRAYETLVISLVSINPTLAGDGDVSVRPARGGAARARRARRRGDRLRQGRPERADRPDDPRRRSSTRCPSARRTRSPPGCPSCARPRRAGASGASASRSTPTTEIVPTYGSKEAIFSLAQVLDTHAAGRSSLRRARVPRVRARRALRRRAGATLPLAARARVPARSRRAARRRRARLGQLPAQPDRRASRRSRSTRSSPSARASTISGSPPTRRTPSSGSTSRPSRRSRRQTARASSSSRR